MRTLDFIIVQEGEVVLVLDTQEVTLRKGDFIVQRGTRYAWSNRTDKPAVLAIASHDGRKQSSLRGAAERSAPRLTFGSAGIPRNNAPERSLA